jgi:hypothetical protein
MKENERRKANFDSQEVECFDADLVFMMSQVSLPIKWDYQAKWLAVVL